VTAARGLEREEVEPLAAELVADLSRPAAHAGDPRAGDGVEVVQTHLSWVFLTPGRVVKVRKAVRLPFVDFGTRALRNEDCLREVHLNRRLAPDVYLGVAPVERGAEGFAVGAVGEALAGDVARAPEHAVVMRRLPAGRDALSLLEAGALLSVHLDGVAETLARFHERVGLGRAAPFASPAWRDAVARPMAANLASLRETRPEGLEPRALERLEARFASRLEALGPALEERRLEGRAVDGHGDVHLQHVWFEGGPEAPLLVDCLEFSAELRRIDAASEVAFLAMDLAYRGRADLGARFLRRYAERSDDYGLYPVVDLYAAYRAAVRAKVAGLASRDPAIAREQRANAAASASRHVALAESLLAEPLTGPLVALCGTVGSGKTTAAERLGDLLEGALVSSDRTRKRLAGLAPQARSAAEVGGGIYAAEWTERTYEAILERAAPVVASGRAAVLDATFASAAQRSRARERAARLGARYWLVEVRCTEATAQERLRRRSEAGRDPSDAGPDFLATSLARFEPPDEWPADRRLVLQSDGPHFEPDLARAAERIRRVSLAG
jgi:aminoglycoside phosphotransferase family enzyme/predicted kinase